MHLTSENCRPLPDCVLCGRPATHWTTVWTRTRTYEVAVCGDASHQLDEPPRGSAVREWIARQVEAELERFDSSSPQGAV